MAGSDKSRSIYRGLLLMDPRITGVVASGNATYSTSYQQAGEAFDTPVPATLSDDMVLQTSGVPEVAGQSFTVTSQDAGFPGRDKAGFIWERTTSAGVTTGPFGWEHPNVATDWEAVVYSDGSVYPQSFQEPDAVTLSDGTVIACLSCLSAATTRDVVTYTRNPATGAWAAKVVVDSEALQYYSHPCMVVLPDDRVLLFFWIEDFDTSTRNIRAYVTSDAGATWDLHARYVLTDAISTSTYTFLTRVGRLRACYLNGDIALFGWLETAAPVHHVFQWASSDLGASFSLVTDIDDEYYPDCTVADGMIILGTVDTAGDQGLIFRRIGTAFQPASTIEVEIDPLAGDDFANGAATNAAGDFTMWSDEDGTVYAAHLIYSGANKEGLLWRSYDAGQSWEQVGQSPLGATWGTFYRTADTTPSYPTGLAGTHCRGSQVLLHNWIAPVGDEDNSLAALWLGGYSTVTNPFHVSFKYRASEVAWTEMWLPYELPSDVSVWTRFATGTESLTAGANLITTTAQTNYYVAAPTSTPEQGLIVQWDTQCTVGGSSSSELDAMRVVIGDASHGYGVSVRMSTTAFRAYDHVSGTALGASATTVDLDGSWVQFRLYIASPSSGVGAFALYYRVNDRPGGPRAWTLAISSAALTDAAGVTVTSIRWGHLANTTSTSRWRQVFYAAGSNTGRIDDHARSGGQSSPTDLNPHDYAPVAIGVADGLKLRAVDGPTFLGSEWTIAPRYEYAIEKILPSVEPSPLEGWRSTDDDTQQDIDFELSGFGDTETLNDTIGLYIEGHNFPVCTLQGFDGGAWTTIFGIDIGNLTGFENLTYINNNGGIRPGTGTEAGGYYFEYNELVGGTIRFEGDAKLRRITGNTEGFWQATTSGVTKQMTITYDEDGTEAASGTDLKIIPPQLLVFAHLAASTYRAYRFRITSAYDTPEGYFTLNKLVVGPVVVFGKNADWGRKYGLGALTDIIENSAGNRRSVKKNRPRRSILLPWTDGIDQSEISGSSAANRADYLMGTTTANAVPIALRNDMASKLQGVMDYTGGGHVPVVYFPKMAKGTPDNTQIWPMRRHSMYGRIMNDFEADVVVGDEDSSELLRVNGLALEEER